MHGNPRGFAQRGVRNKREDPLDTVSTAQGLVEIPPFRSDLGALVGRLRLVCRPRPFGLDRSDMRDFPSTIHIGLDLAYPHRSPELCAG